MAEIQEIEAVTPDVTMLETGTVTNPLDEDFVCVYDGKYRITVPAKGKKIIALPIALHVAKHLSDRIVHAEWEAETLKMATRKVETKEESIDDKGKAQTISRFTDHIDEKLLFEARKRAIPNYKDKLWQTMKTIVKSDSKFFKDKDSERRAMGGSMIVAEENERDLQDM